MKRIILGLALTLIVFTAPLVYRFIDQLRLGQARPESLTLSEEMWFKLHDRLDHEEGIDFLTGVRASSERPEDVILVITASRPVPGELLAELDRMIDDGMGVDVTVKINVVQQGSVAGMPEADPGLDPNGIEPVINE